MKIKVIHVSRRLQWPIWAVLIVSGWLALGGVTILLSSYFGRDVHLCLFKWLTGFACPTCGFTRGLLVLVNGNIIQCWLYNPLLFSLLAFSLIFLIMRVLFARTVQIILTPSERKLGWFLALILFIANWAYIIFYVK